MSYSTAEAYDMLALYFQCHENACVAERVYAATYPDRRHFSRKVFSRLSSCLRQTGQVHPNRVPRRVRRVRNEQNIVNVLGYVQAHPHLGLQRIARDVGVTKSSVQRILKDHHFHPYHIELHQALLETDFDRRLDFCHWLKDMIEEEPHFLSRVLWTDEATFSNTGGVNLHNMHYWSPVNPHWMREVDYQHRWSIHVWCGVVGDQIIGPFFFEGNVNSGVYLNFLINHLPVLLENVPLETRRTMWLQQDGCPAHSSRRVKNFLNQAYPDRWIGRGSLFPWPARSPDLTILDFYLWGRIKDIVYETRPTTPENMMDRIRNAVASITRAEIETAVLSTRRRVNSCIENDGRHFEHM